MQTYANLGGDSGVRGFDISADSIIVEFKDSSLYLYTHATPGQLAVEEMKRLAVAGQGLNSYISRHVRKAYAAKLK